MSQPPAAPHLHDVVDWDTLDAEAQGLRNLIGHVVITFQIIELWLAEELTKLLGMSRDDRHLVAAAMSFGQKADLTCALMHRGGIPHAQGVPVKVIRAALREAEEFRNAIVHSTWAVDSSLGHWVREKSNLRGGYKFSSNQVDQEAMGDGIKAMRTVALWGAATEIALQGAIDTLAALKQKSSG